MADVSGKACHILQLASVYTPGSLLWRSKIVGRKLKNNFMQKVFSVNWLASVFLSEMELKRHTLRMADWSRFCSIFLFIVFWYVSVNFNSIFVLFIDGCSDICLWEYPTGISL